MTISVSGKLEAGEGKVLEVIDTFAGIEQSRRRVQHGELVTLVLGGGSQTLILREVNTEDVPVNCAGEQRHGDLALKVPPPDQHTPAVPLLDLQALTDRLQDPALQLELADAVDQIVDVIVGLQAPELRELTRQLFDTAQSIPGLTQMVERLVLPALEFGDFERAEDIGDLSAAFAAAPEYPVSEFFQRGAEAPDDLRNENPGAA